MLSLVQLGFIFFEDLACARARVVRRVEAKMILQAIVVLLLSLLQVSRPGSVDSALLHGVGSAAADCRDGNYKVSAPPYGSCAGYRTCEAGFYCVNGVRSKCPAGRYGSTAGLNSALCSGVCQAGHYCPIGSVSATANKCGASTHFTNSTTGEKEAQDRGGAALYCPEGTGMPLSVPPGYYSVGIQGTDGADGDNDKLLDTSANSGVDYGMDNELDLRAGIVRCPVGWYCAGHRGSSSTNTSSNTANDRTVRDLRSNAAPVITQAKLGDGVSSTLYAVSAGRRLRCPGGTYGQSEGLGDAGPGVGPPSLFGAPASNYSLLLYPGCR